jgi:hypothetical protein
MATSVKGVKAGSYEDLLRENSPEAFQKDSMSSNPLESFET